MGKERSIVVLADSQTEMKKKAGSCRSWILMDAEGKSTVLDVDKYAIMDRVQIHARDLRILDPLLSYPSTILSREKAIVLNLEHIKAIITHEEVLLRDPLDDNVIPVVEELQRRLPFINSIREGQEDGNELGDQQDVEAGEEDGGDWRYAATLKMRLCGNCNCCQVWVKVELTAAAGKTNVSLLRLNLISLSVMSENIKLRAAHFG
ncbi:Magnesium transporter MRS2-2 [Camellia lanceoleosa]|uniref:Magnesium transporter MRS2-2 n=1 Tax=Camellia lanceoleosa TaxID=1840588 RepID=A0ACC0HAT5_9ERIC|nr:Magnesium transporter MRS2-2 [Camellia lanceoleosa]